MFLLAWWEWRVARQGCLVPLRKGGMWQSSQPASLSLAGLTLCPNWIERWLATLNMLSTQVRIPVELSVPVHYITNTCMHHSASKVNRDVSHYHMGRILLPSFLRRSCNFIHFSMRGDFWFLEQSICTKSLKNYRDILIPVCMLAPGLYLSEYDKLWVCLQQYSHQCCNEAFTLYWNLLCVIKCQILTELTKVFILFSFPIHVYCRLLKLCKLTRVFACKIILCGVS